MRSVKRHPRVSTAGARWRPRPWLGCRWPAVLALPLVASCAELPPNAQKQVASAREDYTKGNYPSARTKLDDVLKSYSSYTGAAEAYYLRAKILAETSRPGSPEKAAALRDAKRCIDLSTDSMLTAKAQAIAGTLEYESGSKASAIRYYADALKHLPEKTPTDLVRYNYATCLQHEGRWSEARREYTTLLQRHPGSDLAERARRMLDWPGDYFTIQCGAFRDPTSATNLSNKLRSAGLSARVEPRTRSGEALNMVYVGRYPTYQAAQSAMASVMKHVTKAEIAP